MDLRKIETFIWVATLGSFRAAANRMNLTQPAISTRIAVLEAELGLKLFKRNTSPLRLTNDGILVMDKAKEIVRSFENLRSAHLRKGINARTLKLGSVGTISESWLPLLIKKIYEKYPSINVDIRVDRTAVLRSLMTAHELDVAFMMGPVYGDEMKNRSLMNVDITWVSSPDNEILKQQVPADGSPLEIFRRIPIVTYSRETTTFVLIRDYLQARGIEPVQFISSSSVSMITQLVTAGVGIGAVARDSVRAELTNGTLRELDIAVPLPSHEFIACTPLEPWSEIGETVVALALNICSGLYDKQDSEPPVRRLTGQFA